MKLHFTTSDHHQQQPLQHKNKTYNHTLTQTRQFGPRLMTWHDTPWKGIQRQCSSDMANKRQLIQKIILKEHQRLAKWRQRDTRLRDVLWCQQKRKMHAEQCYIIILCIMFLRECTLWRDRRRRRGVICFQFSTFNMLYCNIVDR